MKAKYFREVLLVAVSYGLRGSKRGMTLSVDCSKNTSLMAKFSTTGSLVNEDVQANAKGWC